MRGRPPLASSPTCANTATAFSRAAARRIFFSANRPKATFSHTGKLSNSAPFWNSMPICARSCRARWRGAVSTSSPSISMTPASGVTRPRMDLISTDLPVPEPPITTMPVPGMISRSTPSSTCFVAERLLEAADADFRLALI